MHRRPQFEPLARLAAAGCGLFGPWGSRWVGLSCRTRTPGSLVSRLRAYPAGCSCGGFGRRCAFGLAVPLGLGLGAWPLTCVGALILPGAAAAASPPVRVWVGCAAWVCAGRLGCVSRGCVYPTGCGCGGYAACAHLGWLCRLGLGRVLGHRLAWARLTGRVQSPAGGTYHRGTKNLNERTWQDEPTKRKSNGPNNPHPAAASRVSGSNCGRRCTITYPAQG